MIALTAIFMFIALNVPVWVYAWFYIHTHNLVAAGAYFVALIGLSVGFSRIIGWLRKSAPEQSFGCVIVVGFAPGIFLAIFQVVPMLQLWLTPPALNIPIAEVRSHPRAGFFSFSDAILGGKLQHWHREKRTRRDSSTGTTSTYTVHFQVMPVVGPTWKATEAPVVWLTSEDGEGPAFSQTIEQIDDLSGLVLVKPDSGFMRAVEEACRSAKIPVPEGPVLLKRTKNYQTLRASQNNDFLLWLGLYNLIALILVGLGARTMGSKSSSTGGRQDASTDKRESVS